MKSIEPRPCDLEVQQKVLNLGPAILRFDFIEPQLLNFIGTKLAIKLETFNIDFDIGPTNVETPPSMFSMFSTQLRVVFST
jgi:hypothetical protein